MNPTNHKACKGAKLIMKAKSSKGLASMSGVPCVATAFVFALAGTRQDSANWRNVDAQNAWSAYVSQFVFLG